MGKKSRLKRERRESKQHELAKKSSQTHILCDERRESVYRFFKEASHADALAQGSIWLSTLNTCRAYEDQAQGDSGEAHETYNSGHIVGGSDTPQLVEVSRRSGIHIGPGCSNITISNNTRNTSIQDAYVLCTTTEFSPDKLSDTFGRYCVRIKNPAQFFKLVTESLKLSISIKKCEQGEVIYKERFYTGMEPSPGPIGFVKPPDLYASQKEFRLLWIPANASGIAPRLLSCPAVSDLCERIC